MKNHLRAQTQCKNGSHYIPAYCGRGMKMLCSCPYQWWILGLLTVQCLVKRDCCGCCHPGNCIAVPKGMPLQIPFHMICYNTKKWLSLSFVHIMKDTTCRFLDKTFHDVGCQSYGTLMTKLHTIGFLPLRICNRTICVCVCARVVFLFFFFFFCIQSECTKVSTDSLVDGWALQLFVSAPTTLTL